MSNRNKANPEPSTTIQKQSPKAIIRILAIVLATAAICCVLAAPVQAQDAPYYSPEQLDRLVSRCTEVESGARNVDHILTGTLLPTVSREVLTRLGEGRPVKRVSIDTDEKGQFTYGFE